MKYAFLAALPGCLLLAVAAQAQALPGTPPTPPTGPNSPYRASATKVNDLVHTKLAVRFDYAKRYLYGQEWVTLKPHAYATDSLRLDAKGMDIKSVALMNGTSQQPLKYTYSDQNNLRINLGKLFKPGEQYIVYIEYTAKPDELKVKGSAAITDAKGLYFINPDSTVKGKPVQVWTQGETEGSSAWFPTIDRPNQKTTEEIAMTVPAKYVTLSNGQLVSSTPAGPGLRTDTWKMDMPHSPYLFMMAVGDFKIYKDTWRGKEVNYYLEPKYAPFAKQIFGNTPDMLEFFSKRLGVEFPWNKYAQIVVRDYVSGAMENTSATLHGEQVQMTDKELVDREYSGESVIAHELFHQWFGDYVTAESWSNITVNESMADFSEGLYAEHKLGEDGADDHKWNNVRRYLASPRDVTKPLVRFHYADKEEVFDLVSYQKGGGVVDMLRDYLGDDVFFAGLQKYLKDNALGNGEAHQMRLAMEAVSGQDLNWFYNQWYFAPGHPVVTIDYAWDAAHKTQTVTVKQTQAGQVFQLPFIIDYYVKGQVLHQPVTMTEATQTFTMQLPAKPELVNVDAHKKLVWQKKDNKPLAEFAYQAAHAPRYLDRREAYAAAQETQATDPAARSLLMAGLKDKFGPLRAYTVSSLKLSDPAVAKAFAPTLRQLAATEKDPAVQATAVGTLSALKDKKDEALATRLLSTSPSYRVQAAALVLLAGANPAAGQARAKTFTNSENKRLAATASRLASQAANAADWPALRDKVKNTSLSELGSTLPSLLGFMTGTNDLPIFQEGVSLLKNIGVQYKAQGADEAIIGVLQQLKERRAGSPIASGAATAIDSAVAELKATK
ncbi:MAG: M1 family aminopeptidase [Janthinobacterium lividum]